MTALFRLATLATILMLTSPSWSQACGDCDGDGMLTALDALLAARIGAGLVTPTPAQDRLCDVDSSMSVVVLDALLIAQQVAGLPVVLSCPPPPPMEPLWVRSAGTNGYDRGHAVTSENDVIYLAGTKDFVSLTESDGWVMARDPDGSARWDRVYRIPGGGSLELLSITASNGLLYVGGVQRILQAPAPDDVDIVVLTLDAGGILLQQTRIVSPTTEDNIHSITVLADGSLLLLADRTLAGGNTPQAWFINLETNGTIRWQREISSSDGCQPMRAVERPSTGTYVAGRFVAPGSGGFDSFGWLVSLDAAGVLQWHQQYMPNGVGNGFTDLLLDGSGLWLVGYMCSNCFFRDDAWHTRTDLAGNMSSSTLYGNYSAVAFDRHDRILPLPGGSFATVGSSDSLPFTGTVSTVHVYDAGGAPLWARAFGESPRFTQAFDAALTTAGAIAYTGTTNLAVSPSLSDAYFGKILPQSIELDGCRATNIITDIPRDITMSVMVGTPVGAVETPTGATTSNPGLVLVPGSLTPIDAVHCTN